MIRVVDRSSTNKQTKAAKISLFASFNIDGETRRSRDSRNAEGGGKDGEREKVPYRSSDYRVPHEWGK